MSLTYPLHAEALYEALRPDPYFAALERWADCSPGRQAMLAYYDFSMREAAAYGRLFLPEGQASGVSVWLLPQTSERAAQKKTVRENFLLEHFGDRALARYRAVINNMTANAEPLVDEEAWYLSIVGVLPACQNRGLGAKLVGAVLRESDRQGAATWLETFVARNRSFYQRLGYRTAAEFLEPVTGASYALMQRPPAGCRTAGAGSTGADRG